ncbi:MAG: septum site-determining protein MinC [Lachnospiraceae bacterium]|nr:septum site-determining protein MinC [Lachnospiraceae bacterium]
MKELLIIKSFPSGVNLILNEEASFEAIVEEVGVKFSASKAFFGKGNMALSYEGKQLSTEEEIALVEKIRESCDVNIMCIVGKDEETGRQFAKAVEGMEEKALIDRAGQFYKGSLRNDETIETDGSIVILGDVHPGCSVVSGKSIIIIGGLYGEACAGMNGQEGAYVAALDMNPMKLRIGDFKYKSTGKAKKGIFSKNLPQIALVKKDKIVLENLTKDILGDF